MSNPAVITLANSKAQKDKSNKIVIEDNIGESIHLHLDKLRFDFTIKDFIDFSTTVREAFTSLEKLKGFKIEDFDEHFLFECSEFLPDLLSIELDEISLKDLKCIVKKKIRHDLIIEKILPIIKTPSFKYLKGDKKEYFKYEQFNYLEIDNEKRLLELVDSIKKNGYPHFNKHIILFNNQNIIRDGQHRASILAHMHGLDYRINVMRFNFKQNRYSLMINYKNIQRVLRWLVSKIRKKLSYNKI